MPRGCTASHGRLRLVLLAALLVCVVAISDRSLWIDEALTAIKAQLPGIREWWAQMVRERASDLQMPLYMFYIWTFEKAFGSGEWTLRMANTPWFIVGLVVFAWGQRHFDARRFFTLAFVLLSPFAWYYLDEARPYAMQLGSSLIVVGSLCRLDSREKASAEACSEAAAMRLFLVGLVVLSGSNMLGMIWAGAAVLAFPLVAGRDVGLRLVLKARWTVLATAACLAGLAVFYLWSLSIGARASTVATTNAQSVLFIIYELMGFAGLGPGRLELRHSGAGVLKPWLPLIGVYGITLGLVVWAGLREWWGKESRQGFRVWIVTGIVLLPALFILGAGVISTFRVLGRHFTPVFPVLALLLGQGAGMLWMRRSWGQRLAVVVVLALTIGSCLSLRFASRHSKDDYRQAAQTAKMGLLAGKRVWWNAAEEGAEYYGVKLSVDASSNGSAWLCRNPMSEILERIRQPDLIISSKPDVYDNAGTLSRYLEVNRYVRVGHFAAFVVWARPTAAPQEPDKRK